MLHTNIYISIDIYTICITYIFKIHILKYSNNYYLRIYKNIQKYLEIF